jgi:hypothetical protein
MSATLSCVNQRLRIVVVVLVLTGVAVWLLFPNNKARRAAERTRDALRQQGFKLDLSEFELSTPAGIGANNEILMLAGDASRAMFSVRRIDLMRPVNSNSAMVTWKQENRDGDLANDFFWSDLRNGLAERSALLDRASEAVLSGPFRFRTVLATNNDVAPDVFRARLLGSALAARTILELHEQHHSAAWTNLLALTRLVTAWQTEPMEISHFTRFRWVTTAQRVTWEALQARDWTDSELATLQGEWESPNFFVGLPETAALARAGTIAFCEYQRQKPPPSGPTLREFASALINSPHRAWSDATAGWRNARYRNYESYEDQTAWLLYFRDCELDYRRALTANSWSELRNLPTATNSRPTQASNSGLGLEALRNVGPGAYGGYQRQGSTLLARAGEAEARRRLLVTAIAIERFHLANHSYPDSLAKLVPYFLKSLPKDFMDAEPLRYRRTDDDRFLLYSIGTDGQDDHGQLLVDGSPGVAFNRPEGPDLVWPLPATSAEVQAFAQAAESRRLRAPSRATSESRTFRRYGMSTQPMRTNTLSMPNPAPVGPNL